VSADSWPAWLRFSNQMNIQILEPATAPLWSEAVSVAVLSGKETNRIEVLLEAGLFRPHLRIVVVEEGRPFGRLAARLDAQCIRVWNPEFRNGMGTDKLNEAMRLMIRCVLAARIEAGLTGLAIENRPGDDLKHNDLWLCMLREQGFVETCAYRVYALPLDQIQQPRSREGVTTREIDHSNEDVLVALHRSVKSRTLEQRRDLYDRPEKAIEGMKQVGRRAVWLLGCVDGAPAAYGLANLVEEADFEGLSAWLVDIGRVPEQRCRGIASGLLAEIVQRLCLLGVRRLFAAIDDVNLASIRLHMSLGFRPVPGRHYVYRSAA